MIKIKMKRYDRIVELQLPTEYEHVMVCLWKLGLERDPAKYTLRDLKAVISYDTSWEHQIIRLVSIGNTLEDRPIFENPSCRQGGSLPVR